MNIVYIEHYAGAPQYGMEYRPYHLAREWVRSGHKVHVFAASFSHVRAKQPQLGGRGDEYQEIIDGITYHWVSACFYRGNGWGRLKNISDFLLHIWFRARKIVDSIMPDVVIASSTYPMDIWVAKRLSRLAGARLVFEVHDLWPLSLIEVSGLSRWHPFVVLCGIAEATAYRHANVVISILPKAGVYMVSKGMDVRKLGVVPNGISPDEWLNEPESLPEELAAEINAAHAAGRFVVGYTGSMGLPNALDTLLDAASLIKNQPIKIILVGGGLEKARLAKRVQDESLENVKIFDSISKAQVRKFLSSIDVAYIGWQKVSLYRFGISPNKLMDYMMARCPILHSVDAANDPVSEAGCGLTVAPESARAVADGLVTLTALPVNERQAMGERGRRYVLREHAYPRLARRFLEQLNRNDV